MKIHNKTIFFLFALISFLIILFPNGLSGQVIHSSQRYNYIINKEVQEKHMTFFTSYQTGGRSVASKGNLDCRNYVCAEFEKYGLLPLSAKGYVQEFHLPKYSGKGGNVIGYIPAKNKSMPTHTIDTKVFTKISPLAKAYQEFYTGYF